MLQDWCGVQHPVAVLRGWMLKWESMTRLCQLWQFDSDEFQENLKFIPNMGGFHRFPVILPLNFEPILGIDAISRAPDLWPAAQAALGHQI